MILIRFAMATLMLIFLGCTTPRNGSQLRGAAVSSILVEASGVSSEDLLRKETRFTLHCRAAPGSDVFADAQQISHTSLGFAGESIKDGLQCELEMRFVPTSDEVSLYHWYSSTKESGLIYSSQFKTMTNRSIDLPLYKVYEPIKELLPNPEGEISGYDLSTRCLRQDAETKTCLAIKWGIPHTPWYAKIQYQMTDPLAAHKKETAIAVVSSNTPFSDSSNIRTLDVNEFISQSGGLSSFNKKFALLDSTNLESIPVNEPKMKTTIESLENSGGFENTRFINILAAYSFGVGQIDRKDLGASSENAWFALIRAKKEQKSVSYIITDVSDEFLPLPGKSAIDFGLTAEPAESTAPSRDLSKKLRALAFKGSALAAANCKLSQKQFVDTLHARKRDEKLRPDFKKNLWDCELKIWPKEYEEWDQSIKVFRWGWHATIF